MVNRSHNRACPMLLCEEWGSTEPHGTPIALRGDGGWRHRGLYLRMESAARESGRPKPPPIVARPRRKLHEPQHPMIGEQGLPRACYRIRRSSVHLSRGNVCATRAQSRGSEKRRYAAFLLAPPELPRISKSPLESCRAGIPPEDPNFPRFVANEACTTDTSNRGPHFAQFGFGAHTTPRSMRRGGARPDWLMCTPRTAGVPANGVRVPRHGGVRLENAPGRPR